MFVNLTNDNILIYAVKSYEGLNYLHSEFQEDYRLFQYTKRLLQRYRTTGEIKLNLILNHLNMIYNTFGAEAGTRILFFKINELDYSSLKTFLIYLNYMPSIVTGIRGEDIVSSDIPVDMHIAKLLRNI
jgi:hypothetical protein